MCASLSAVMPSGFLKPIPIREKAITKMMDVISFVIVIVLKVMSLKHGV